MHLITLSALFLFASTTLAAPLDLSSRQETYSSLALRDGVADTGAAFEITARSDFGDDNWLERRSKTVVNKAARQARKTAAKAVVAQARKDGGSTAALAKKKELKNVAQVKHADLKAAGEKHSQKKKVPGRLAVITPARNGKPERTGKDVRKDRFDKKHAAQVKQSQLKAAGVEHRKTTGLPGRNQRFTVPAGGGKPQHTYTGKDVRKANFASHIKNSAGKKFGKPFSNRPHDNAGTSGTTHPIPGMVGKGHEHPLSGATTFSQMKKDHRTQPARIISQTDTHGNHRHMGVIAHDQSRPSGQFGANDHFRINPT